MVFFCNGITILIRIFFAQVPHTVSTWTCCSLDRFRWSVSNSAPISNTSTYRILKSYKPPSRKWTLTKWVLLYFFFRFILFAAATLKSTWTHTHSNETTNLNGTKNHLSKKHCNGMMHHSTSHFSLQNDLVEKTPQPTLYWCCYCYNTKNVW